MISVCLATYNGAAFIQEQLASILPQLSPEDEVIISDDGSTDGTLEIIAAFHSPLVRVVSGKNLHSPMLNFENALLAARGGIIFLSDQDDCWVEGKVGIMVEALKDCDCVVSDCYVTDGQLRVTADSFYALNRTRTGRFHNLFVRNAYLGCCMAFRRCVLERALPIPRRACMHDVWIGNVAAFYYSIRFIPEKLIYFRRHGHNASSSARKSRNSLLTKIAVRLEIAAALLRLYFKKQ